jgi:hypothetical protein
MPLNTSLFFSSKLINLLSISPFSDRQLADWKIEDGASGRTRDEKGNGTFIFRASLKNQYFLSRSRREARPLQYTKWNF